MFSLPDFSVKRPVCVFICLVSLILFGVSSVFEMPLESTPEMNMPTMTIMTSYPDASPDEVDEMVTQKIESALSGITEVESMTSTSSEGSSMIMLEFGCDVDTDDKYRISLPPWLWCSFRKTVPIPPSWPDGSSA